MCEKRKQLRDRNLHQFTDSLSSYFYIGSLSSQPASPALRADCFPPVTGKHHPVLNLVFLLLQVVKETVNPPEGAIALPEKLTLFICELEIGSMDGEVEELGL